MTAWDFITNATVDTIETVPDEHQAYYVEDKAAGKFVLKADIVPLATALTNTQKSLTKANLTRKEDGKKDATRRVALDTIKNIFTEVGVEFEDDDVAKIPDVLKAKVTELVESGKSGKDNKVDIAKVRTAMEGQITNLKKEFEVEKTGLMKSIEKLTIDNVAISALTEAGVIETGPELLIPKVRSSVKVVKNDDGDYVARVIDTDGTPKVNSTGSEMSLKDLVGELKTKYPAMFKSKELGGGGSQSQATKPGAKAVGGKGEMSSVDKIAGGLNTIKK